MAHFYAEIKGNRGEGTRCGTKSSGIRGHIRGWNIGVKVIIQWDENLQEDVVKVFKTSGSNGYGDSELIAKFSEKEETTVLQKLEGAVYG